MKRFVFCVAVVSVAAFLLASDTAAQYPSCNVRQRVAYSSYPAQVYHAPTYYAPAHYHPPVVATLLNFTVPSYSVGYSAGGDAQLQIELLKLKAEVLQMKLEQVRLPEQPPQPGQQAKQLQARINPNGGRLKVFLARCASCHDAATAAGKGNGLVLTSAGQLAPLTYTESLAVTKAIYTGTMPKNGKLTDEEAGLAIVDPSPQK